MLKATAVFEVCKENTNPKDLENGIFSSINFTKQEIRTFVDTRLDIPNTIERTFGYPFESEDIRSIINKDLATWKDIRGMVFKTSHLREKKNSMTSWKGKESMKSFSLKSSMDIYRIWSVTEFYGPRPKCLFTYALYYP